MLAEAAAVKRTATLVSRMFIPHEKLLSVTFMIAAGAYRWHP